MASLNIGRFKGTIFDFSNWFQPKHGITGSSTSVWTFHVIPQDSNPRYAALSYAWGGTYSPEPILLENGSFWITQNLRDALQRLQSHEQAHYLRVNAICIIQLDDLEKSHQIRMMRMIYEKAHAVLVWLGQPENQENTRLAFRKIEYFDEIRKSHIGKKAFSGPRWWPRKPEPVEELLSSMLARLLPSDKEVFDSPGTPTYRAWQGICSILTCNWWRRTWVCQEATIQEPRHFIMQNHAVSPPLAKIEFLYGAFATTLPKLINTADIGDILEKRRGVNMGFMGDSQANFRRMMSIRALHWECES